MVISISFQEPIAFPFSVEKNLSLLLDYHEKMTRDEREREIIELLKKVGLYDEVKNKMKSSDQELSGGQRLANSKGLMCKA